MIGEVVPVHVFGHDESATITASYGDDIYRAHTNESRDLFICPDSGLAWPV